MRTFELPRGGEELGYSGRLFRDNWANDAARNVVPNGFVRTVQLAASVEAKGLILEAPMSSATDVARVHYPYLLASSFLQDAFRSIDHIKDIDMPLLVMHGDQDRVIPVNLGKKLVDQAAEPKMLVVLEGAGHNNLGQFSTEAIARDFIESL